jgi:two-component system, OmpR family, sensor histidine kinase KdpD
LVRAGAGQGASASPADLSLGDIDPDERAGLLLSCAQHQALGPGTGRHEEQPAWYLPLRGRGLSVGAALLRLHVMAAEGELRRVPLQIQSQAQALCDLMGLAIERARDAAAAAAAREEAQAHKLRNTLLAAISHDYRTPLATILGAASSLQDQGERLTVAQRRRLATTIVDEADQLARLTSNALQLARLDAPGLVLPLDWESAEEIVGSAVRRVRQRDAARRVTLRIEPGLPLLRCDAVLLVQLLENLMDNAFKYGGDAPVDVVARQRGDRLLLAVRDRGPGVAPAWRERIFDGFQRGEPAAAPAASTEAPARRGAGVGLAVCRAIARAHGGELRLRARSHGGASFECLLPVAAQPAPHGAADRGPTP